MNTNPKLRYHGKSLKKALTYITNTVSRRILSPTSFPSYQSKNNTSLILTLSRLSGVPLIRLLATISLNSYLHSPFLAPLARDLFVKITRSISPSSPPLASDMLITISLTNLRLKSAHVQFYIDNMVAMVKR